MTGDAAGQAAKRVLAAALRTVFRGAVSGRIPRRDARAVIVIRQHDQLGDMICSIPLIDALKSHYPRAHLTLVASPVNFEIMRHHRGVDSVVKYDKGEFFRSPSAFAAFLREVRSREYDLAVVPGTVSVSMTSDLLSRFSRARVRIGPASLARKENPCGWCHTIPVPLDWGTEPRRHQVFRNLDILKALGIGERPPGYSIGLTPSEIESARSELRELRDRYPTLVGIHPGAGKPENRWPADRFAALANRLQAESGAGIVVTAGPMDDEPLRGARSALASTHLLVQRRPIRAVAAIINELDLFVSNDTGIMHVAGGTSAPLLALFGPTDPLVWAPPGKKNRFISGRDRTVASITIEEAFEACSLVLASRSRI